MTHIPRKALEYLKATTAFGGDSYGDFAQGFTEENCIAFETFLSRQDKANGITLYRGYNFEPHYWEDCMVEVGSVIGEDQMTASLDLPAFTTGPIRAALYMNEFGDGVGRCGAKVLFEIETKGKHFVDVSQFSVYKEGEYRCERGTRVKVIAIVEKGGYQHIKCIEV